MSAKYRGKRIPSTSNCTLLKIQRLGANFRSTNVVAYFANYDSPSALIFCVSLLCIQCHVRTVNYPIHTVPGQGSQMQITST